MIAFAGNSLLCRVALKHTAIDPVSFTGIRIVSGALTLWLLVRMRTAPQKSAGNFLRAALLAACLGLGYLPWAAWDRPGILYAVASGALASGLGYAVWYTALRGLAATTAASVQLSVPVIAAVGGILLLEEPLTLRLVLCSVAILGGIALVTLFPKLRPAP
jgi:drug/metabolite transporter (DMT)-like permease